MLFRSPSPFCLGLLFQSVICFPVPRGVRGFRPCDSVPRVSSSLWVSCHGNCGYDGELELLRWRLGYSTFLIVRLLLTVTGLFFWFSLNTYRFFDMPISLVISLCGLFSHLASFISCAQVLVSRSGLSPANSAPVGEQYR